MGGQSFHLKLTQTQQLNQGLQQSLRVLQMSGLELEREVDDWLQDNPLLERREPADDGRLEPQHLSAAVSSRNQIGGDEAEDVWATVADEEDFNRYLHKQVCEHPLSEEEAAHVHIVIDFLDDQGYLTDTPEEIVEHTPLEWMLDEDDIQTAIDHLQNFDPPGVGAADLRESLMLQLQRLPASPSRQCAGQIVSRFLDELNRSSSRNVEKFKKALPDYTSDIIESALDLIGSLNPYPAYGFAAAEPTSVIQPDFFGREGDHVLPGERIVGREVRNHALGPGFTVLAGPAEILDEAGAGRVEEVGQQVHGKTRGGARHFGATDEADTGIRDGGRGLVPPGRRVVVGQRDSVEPGLRGDSEELRGSVGSIRVRAMSMGVYSLHHLRLPH